MSFMRIDTDELYRQIALSWYKWAEDHGQVPVWPPRYGSQTHHMALMATNAAVEVGRVAEREVLEDVALFVRMQKKVHPKQAALLDAVAAALEDGSWEDM